MKLNPPLAALALTALQLPSGTAQTLAPTPIFEGNTTTRSAIGTAEPVYVSIQEWAIAGQDKVAQELPLRGLYIANLISGHISATIDGQTTDHLPGDYWTVKSGTAMQIRVLGEAAILETTAVSKQ